MTKISVIVPVYNLENYLDETIKSIVNQTFDDYEVIFVDDGSNDNSIKIIEKYPQITLYKINHQGAGSARNFGFKKAKGDYILFLDGDDVFDKNYLSKMYQAAIEYQADLVVCCSKELDKTKIYNNNPYPCGWAWDKLVKKDLIEKYNLNFSSFNSSEDFLFSYGAYFLAEKIVYLEDSLVFHRIRKKSLSKKRMVENIFFAAKELMELLANNNVFEKRIDDFRNIVLKSFIWHYLDFKNIYKKYLAYKLIKNYEKEFKILDLKDVKSEKYFRIYQEIINSKNYFMFLLNYICVNYKIR